MNKLVKDALILTLITLIAGVALGLVYEVTKGPIEAANTAAVQAAYKSLFPHASDFDDEEDFDEAAATAVANEELSKDSFNKFTPGDLDIKGLVHVYDEDGADIGKIITVTSHKGYGGDITLYFGIDSEGNVRGYQITNISETPGLGMKSKEEKFSSQFVDIPVDTYYVVIKTSPGEGEIEAISGATITSRAVTNPLNAAIAYYNSIMGGGIDE